MLKTVAQLVAEQPKYADLTTRFVFVAHSWFQNADVMTLLMTRLKPRTVLEIGGLDGGRRPVPWPTSRSSRRWCAWTTGTEPGSRTGGRGAPRGLDGQHVRALPGEHDPRRIPE